MARLRLNEASRQVQNRIRFMIFKIRDRIQSIKNIEDEYSRNIQSCRGTVLTIFTFPT